MAVYTKRSVVSLCSNFCHGFVIIWTLDKINGTIIVSILLNTTEIQIFIWLQKSRLVSKQTEGLEFARNYGMWYVSGIVYFIITVVLWGQVCHNSLLHFSWVTVMLLFTSSMNSIISLFFSLYVHSKILCANLCLLLH